MKKNMGVKDRIIRVDLVIVIAALYLTNIITGTLALVLTVITGMFILTSFVGFCPFYFSFGISTKRKLKQ
jgi:hypothetical protein